MLNVWYRTFSFTPLFEFLNLLQGMNVSTDLSDLQSPRHVLCYDYGHQPPPRAPIELYAATTPQQLTKPKTAQSIQREQEPYRAKTFESQEALAAYKKAKQQYEIEATVHSTPRWKPPISQFDGDLPYDPADFSITTASDLATVFNDSFDDPPHPNENCCHEPSTSREC